MSLSVTVYPPLIWPGSHLDHSALICHDTFFQNENGYAEHPLRCLGPQRVIIVVLSLSRHHRRETACTS